MNIKKLYIPLVAAGMLLGACSKEKLEPVPQTSLPPSEAFTTATRALQQLNGVYAAFKNGQFAGGRVLVYQDVRGEDFLNLTNNGVTAFLTWNFTVTPTANEVQNAWSAGYAAINRANVVIDGLANSPIDAAVRTAYIGEAKALRALSYFTLLQLYARPFADGNGSQPGLPLRLQAETNIGSQDLARATVAQVYEQILKDLNEAEPAVLQTHANPTLNATRIHRNTVIALKTRVYLAMARYADVITEANKIVPASAPFVAASGVPNQLLPSIATVFAPPYVNNEVMFTLPFTTLDLPGTQNGLGHYYNPGPNGNGDFTLNTTGNGIVANTTAWPASDARRAFNVASGTTTFLRKWPNNPGSAPDWTPVIRYAEVLLNLSEAIARTTSGVDARSLALLNAVRRRSDATVTLAPATNADLVSAILTERRIEFLGEGLRTMDITRLLQPFPAKGSVSALPPTAPQYIWPIPNPELITNKAIVQNTGY